MYFPSYSSNDALVKPFEIDNIFKFCVNKESVIL